MPSPTANKSSAEREEPEAAPAPTITSAVPYTAEEKACLLAYLTAPPQEQQEQQRRDGDAAWAAKTLPLLASMVAKVLRLAADNYEDGGTAGASAADAPAAEEEAPRRSGSTAPSKMDCFLEENAYFLEQLQLQSWPFFTLPRLCEILANPFMYNSDASGKLRGAKLQAAVRRCVLASAPLFAVPSPLMSMSEVNTG
ncbi:uncharacterized protein Tco025E_03328 [Trypanosoma conorhini]|uniref:Uncharacterized protein n=1 Tax=Trypanosoma conorhini TaxID=83891 RepID=A0A422PUW8_9TRYP|nr:uncharacterized protein Tco025E_03328 [Trypanosoma conorhini]RNF21526.1 hypothetical protein Tco025E_03328 [Trypanosoma conorhini]